MSRLRLRAGIIGDARVGKTSIVNRYLKKYEFNTEEATTVGAMFDTIAIDRDGRPAELEIWDTAGQENYRSLISNYLRNAHGAALVFDVTVATTFNHLSNWLETFRSIAGRDRPVLIIGNKTDLPQRNVQWGDAVDFATEHNCQYLETSALTGEGIEIAFETLIDSLISTALADRERGAAAVPPPPPSSCC
jgi:small GTP-binding protein